MSVEAFARGSTLAAVPDAIIEVERVVATERALTPYCSVATVGPAAFAPGLDDDVSTFLS